MASTGRPRRRATTRELGALASATRLRILRLTLDEPMTNQQIAQRLGLSPATALYHVRRLVEAELLEALPPRPRPGGGVEVPYRSNGTTWGLDIAEEDRPLPAMLDAFLAEVQEVGVDRLEQAVRMRLFLTRPRRRELVDRLVALLDEYHDDETEGEPWSLFFAMHPDPPSGGAAEPGRGPSRRVARRAQ